MCIRDSGCTALVVGVLALAHDDRAGGGVDTEEADGVGDGGCALGAAFVGVGGVGDHAAVAAFGSQRAGLSVLVPAAVLAPGGDELELGDPGDGRRGR